LYFECASVKPEFFKDKLSEILSMFDGVSSSLCAEDVLARAVVASLSKPELVLEGVSPKVFE
jgi:hypothetical protein